MLHIILGILTILLTILKWLGILLLILLLLALLLLAVVLLVPVRYRGRGKKTAEKLEAQLSVTWLLRLLAVEAAVDAGGGSLEIRIFGRTLEAWRALLKRCKRKKRGKAKPESLETSRKKREGAAKGVKRTQKESPMKTGKSHQNPEEKPKIPKENSDRSEEVKKTGSAETSTDITDDKDKTEEERKNTCAAEQIQKLPESLKKEACETDISETAENKIAESNLPGPVKIENSGQGFTGEQTDKQSKNLKETQKTAQREKAEEEQAQNEAGRFSKILTRIRGFLSGLPQKVVQIFRLLKKIAGGGLKAAQSIRAAVPKLIEKIRHILHQPAIFLQFWEKYEVGEVLDAVKSELFTLLGHYRPRHLSGYLKFGTGDPAQTGELTGVLYLLLPTQEYEILPDFEETQFETETEFSGHIRSIHLLVTAYHLLRNKKLKRLIRKLRKKGE